MNHHLYPSWVLNTGIALFDLSILAFIALMLGEIGKTTRWRTPSWVAWAWSKLTPRGRHARPYLRRLAPAPRFAPGRVSVAATPTMFVPDPDQPGDGGERDGDEPVPDPTIPVNLAALAQLERDFRTGHTTTHPGAAALIRDAYLHPEKYRTLAGVR